MSLEKAVVLWTILSLSPSGTFEDLLKAVQAGRYAIVKTPAELSSCSLTSVYVGSEKSSLSLVQKDLVAADVVSAFGHFIKYIVSVDEPAPTATRHMVKSISGDDADPDRHSQTVSAEIC
jgi:predicted dinucleotide-binding enzyme